MKDTILITGGSGLLALNWASTVRDRYAVTLGLHEQAVSLPGVAARHLSLESLDSILSAFEAIRPQMVIHTAGLTNVEECDANPDLARHVNVDLAEHVSQACACCDSRFVVIGAHEHLTARLFGDIHGDSW